MLQKDSPSVSGRGRPRGVTEEGGFLGTTFALSGIQTAGENPEDTPCRDCGGVSVGGKQCSGGDDQQPDSGGDCPGKRVQVFT